MKNVKVLTALGMMSLASTATLAASAVPTLGSVLDASGIKVSGDVAASYTNDGPNGQFNFDQALLSVAYQPKDGFGAVVTLAAGDANGELGASTDAYLQQAYVQYANGGLTVIGGRFATLAGYETFAKSGNGFVSHSFSYGAEPTIHAGVRASYAFGDMVSVSVGLLNAIYSQTSSNYPDNTEVGDNAVEAGVTVTPVKGLSLSAAYYNDQNGHGKDDDQSFLNFIASYNVTNAVSVALSYDHRDEGNFAGGSIEGKGTALAAYVNYALSDKYRLGLRLEDVNVDRSLEGVSAASTAFDEVFANNRFADLQSASLVFGYSPVKSFELRTELTDVKTKKTSINKSDTNYAGAVQGVFKF